MIPSGCLHAEVELLGCKGCHNRGNYIKQIKVYICSYNFVFIHRLKAFGLKSRVELMCSPTQMITDINYFWNSGSPFHYLFSLIFQNALFLKKFKPIEYQHPHLLGKWKYSIKLIVIQKLKYFSYSYKCYKYNDYIFYCTYLLLLCENTKKYEYAYPGSNKVVYGAWEQESEEKNEKFYFWICKIRLSEKKIANAKKKVGFHVYQKKRLDE